jgi:hypothetical protein
MSTWLGVILFSIIQSIIGAKLRVTPFLFELMQPNVLYNTKSTYCSNSKKSSISMLKLFKGGYSVAQRYFLIHTVHAQKTDTPLQIRYFMYQITYFT